ncbi:MAG: restriction endonuclease subunit S [Sulfuricurvum sp.]|nr:restriction endonuclease subunit S [Sulfuricurvum sp.]MDP3023148.1 restriction endonuclease subunit S [Sulfuricurvum sp.]
MVKEGYKQTDIGVIPKDWEVKAIGEMLQIKHGKNQKDVITTNGMYPILGTGGEIGRSDTPLYSKPSVLIGRKGTINKPRFMDTPFWTVDTLFYSEIESTAEPKFLFYQFNRIDWYLYNEASGVPSLNAKTIENIHIPIPLKPEQKAIAQVLSDVDELITSLGRLIAKNEAIKQGTMQQLLAGRKRLAGFSGEWEEKKLGDFGVFFKGSGIKKDESNSGDIPCIRYGEIYTYHNEYVKQFKSFISKSVAKSAQLIKQGDLLFAGSGETKEDIGKCVAYVNNFDAYAGGDIVIFSPKNVDSLFLGFLLNISLVAKQKANKGQGDAVVHISANSLSEIQIRIPINRNEQQAIAKVLSDMDNKIEMLKSKLSKTKAIKEAMMSELLTGKTRLTQGI